MALAEQSLKMTLVTEPSNNHGRRHALPSSVASLCAAFVPQSKSLGYTPWT